MEEKPPSREELMRRINEAAREGRVQFAPPPSDAYFTPEFADRFFKEIVRHKREDCWCSQETSVLDFRWADRAAVLHDLQRVYGVDCADIPALNLWEVMRRCADAGPA